MQTACQIYPYKLYEYMNEGNFKNNEEAKQTTLSELQAKIIELETELKKQKEDADKGSKIIKMIWGDEFESDSLH